MKHKFFAAILIVTAFSWVNPRLEARASGSEHEGKGKTEKVTVVGEVIDHVCYIRHDSRGAGHKKCAESCAKMGVTLAILNEENNEILLAFPTGHSNPNEKLMDYIAQKVKVSGILYERGGVKGIEVETVETVD